MRPICARVLVSALVSGVLASCNDERLQQALEQQQELDHQVGELQSKLSETVKRVAALEQTLTAIRSAASQSSIAVQLDCPPDWQRVSDAAGQTLWACRAAAPTADGFWPNCNVTSGLAEAGQSASDYMHTALEGAPELHDARRLAARDRTLAGIPAYEAEYEHSLGGRPTRVIAAVVVKDQRAFAITCSVPPDLFAKYEPAFHGMIGSFRFGG